MLVLWYIDNHRNKFDQFEFIRKLSELLATCELLYTHTCELLYTHTCELLYTHTSELLYMPTCELPLPDQRSPRTANWPNKSSLLNEETTGVWLKKLRHQLATSRGISNLLLQSATTRYNTTSCCYLQRVVARTTRGKVFWKWYRYWCRDLGRKNGSIKFLYLYNCQADLFNKSKRDTNRF